VFFFLKKKKKKKVLFSYLTYNGQPQAMIPLEELTKRANKKVSLFEI